MLKVAYFLRKIQTLRVDNSRILRSKNAKFSGYYFYLNPNIQGDFEICISVPLSFILQLQQKTGKYRKMRETPSLLRNYYLYYKRVIFVSTTKIGENATNISKLLFFTINLHFVTSNQISTFRKLNLPLSSSI